ncbi:MAG: hypothetical protein NTY47_05985, partial [Candidatus Omnitrophica bacterium]|nr:hypothetical protein [Candidatus Omnitrophota bacterium]
LESPDEDCPLGRVCLIKREYKAPYIFEGHSSKKFGINIVIGENADKALVHEFFAWLGETEYWRRKGHVFGERMVELYVMWRDELPGLKDRPVEELTAEELEVSRRYLSLRDALRQEFFSEEWLAEAKIAWLFENGKMQGIDLETYAAIIHNCEFGHVAGEQDSFHRALIVDIDGNKFTTFLNIHDLTNRLNPLIGGISSINGFLGIIRKVKFVAEESSLEWANTDQDSNKKKEDVYDWDDLCRKLTANGWAMQLGPLELQVTADLQDDETRSSMQRVLGNEVFLRLEELLNAFNPLFSSWEDNQGVFKSILVDAQNNLHALKQYCAGFISELSGKALVFVQSHDGKEFELALAPLFKGELCQIIEELITTVESKAADKGGAYFTYEERTRIFELAEKINEILKLPRMNFLKSDEAEFSDNRKLMYKVLLKILFPAMPGEDLIRFGLQLAEVALKEPEVINNILVFALTVRKARRHRLENEDVLNMQSACGMLKACGYDFIREMDFAGVLAVIVIHDAGYRVSSQIRSSLLPLETEVLTALSQARDTLRGRAAFGILLQAIPLGQGLDLAQASDGTQADVTRDLLMPAITAVPRSSRVSADGLADFESGLSACRTEEAVGQVPLKTIADLYYLKQRYGFDITELINNGQAVWKDPDTGLNFCVRPRLSTEFGSMAVGGLEMACNGDSIPAVWVNLMGHQIYYEDVQDCGQLVDPCNQAAFLIGIFGLVKILLGPSAEEEGIETIPAIPDCDLEDDYYRALGWRSGRTIFEPDGRKGYDERLWKERDGQVITGIWMGPKAAIVRCLDQRIWRTWNQQAVDEFYHRLNGLGLDLSSDDGQVLLETTARRYMQSLRNTAMREADNAAWFFRHKLGKLCDDPQEVMAQILKRLRDKLKAQNIGQVAEEVPVEAKPVT